MKTPTHFIFWKVEDKKYSGYAKYFGIEQYKARIEDNTLIVNGKRVGKVIFFDKPIKVRADKTYNCIGIISAFSNTVYHILEVEKDKKYLVI